MADSHTKQLTPGNRLIAVTPGTGDLTNGICRSLWIGTAGNITIQTPDGVEAGPLPVLAGMFPIKCLKVLVTETSPATDIFAIN